MFETKFPKWEKLEDGKDMGGWGVVGGVKPCRTIWFLKYNFNSKKKKKN